MRGIRLWLAVAVVGWQPFPFVLFPSVSPFTPLVSSSPLRYCRGDSWGHRGLYRKGNYGETGVYLRFQM